jgi:hypothetical protein
MQFGLLSPRQPLSNTNKPSGFYCNAQSYGGWPIRFAFEGGQASIFTAKSAKNAKEKQIFTPLASLAVQKIKTEFNPVRP